MNLFDPNLTRKHLYKRLHALAIPMGHLTDQMPAAQAADSRITDDLPPAAALSDRTVASCCTDGTILYWSPACSLNDQTAEAFLLHALIHCLFGHLFRMPGGCSHGDWSLACDISAWYMASLWLPELVCDHLKQCLRRLAEQYPDLPLYQAAAVADAINHTDAVTGAAAGISADRKALNHCFCLDDHSRWPVFARGTFPSADKKASGDGGNGSSAGEAIWRRLQTRLLSANGPLALERRSKSRTESVESLAGNPAGNQAGSQAGMTRRRVTLTKTRRHDYRELLKSLAQWGEEVCANEEEFPYAPYLYGLEHYRDLPLIEPLEYQETKRIRELAIVIDTSASCSHSLTQAFLEETRNLLQEESLFFHPFNLHILQCDVKVQRDDRLTCAEDLTHYIETLEIHGMGGTDFRPAFARIASHIKSREFTRLSGILYFTDGSGIYPEQNPGIRTVFLFLKNQYDAIDVPAWAQTLVLDMA